jgi:voltage-gated potassium channel
MRLIFPRGDGSIEGLPQQPVKRLLIALLLLLAIIGGGTIGYKLFVGTQHDWLDCLFMTVITLSGVGYSEIIDTSMFPGARTFTIFLILSMMGIWLYVVSTLTSIMVEMDLRNVFKRRKMKKEIENLRNHIIVCGAGATGSRIARELADTGASFVLIESDPDHIEALERAGDILYIQGDATTDEVLITAGIERAEGLAAALSSEKDNLFLTLTARQLNSSIRIVARGLDESVNQKLHRAGADAIVSPAAIGGLRMASELLRPTVVSFLDTMLRGATSTIRFEELNITPDSKHINQTIKATNLREQANLLIVALRRAGDQGFEYNPPADTVLTEGMTLVILGESKEVSKLKLHGSET